MPVGASAAAASPVGAIPVGASASSRAVGHQRGARRDVELRLRCGDDGGAQPLRQLLGHQRNVGAAADGRDRGHIGHRNVVALQRFFDGGEQTGQRLGDEVLELVAGHPDVGVEAGQLGGHHRRRLGGQPLLGLPRLVAQPGQRSEPQRAGGIGVVGFGDSGHHMVEQCLVDLVAGEVGIPDRLADLVEIRTGVGQRDAGPAAAQVAQARRRRSTASPVRPAVRRAPRPNPGSAPRAHRPARGSAWHAAHPAAHRRFRDPNARARRSRWGRRRRPCAPSRRGPRRAPSRRGAGSRRRRPAEPGRRPARRNRSAPCRAGSGSGSRPARRLQGRDR